MQRRIRGYELATIQTHLELTGLQQQVAALRVQVSESAAALQEAEQDLESVQDQLIKEQSMRENLSRELTQADQQAHALKDRLQQAEALVVLLKSQLGQPASTQAQKVQGEAERLGRS